MLGRTNGRRLEEPQHNLAGPLAIARWPFTALRESPGGVFVARPFPPAMHKDAPVALSVFWRVGLPRTRDKRRRSGYGSGFVMLPRFMLKSPAWRSLSTPARAIYVELECRYYGTNNGDIALSVREASKLCRSAKDTAAHPPPNERLPFLWVRPISQYSGQAKSHFRRAAHRPLLVGWISASDKRRSSVR